MLARLQQILVLVLLFSAIVPGVLLASHGYAAWGIAVTAIVLTSHALFLAVEFIMLHFVQENGPVPKANCERLLRAWWAEVLTAPRIFFWRQPFRSRVEPDHLPEPINVRRGVVLVHGFFCNRGLWNPWIRDLRALGVPCVAVNLEPLFGSIDRYADAIETAVARLEALSGQSVVLVGHSMGGLAIRAWLRHFTAYGRVHRIITIGSPHQGTWLARFGRTVNGRQMREISPWLVQLATEEPANAADLFTCFYGHCDNIVFPAARGTLPGALNLHVAGTAHVHMLFHRVVFNEVLRWLAADEAASAVESRRVAAAR